MVLPVYLFLISFQALFGEFTHGATVDDWRSRSIYQVLTDRFALSDNSTTQPCNAPLANYCGGQWRGIINQLDYIQGMGFSAIWISPVTYQFQGMTLEGAAYHGYWQQDMYRLNANFGTEQDLKDLAAALHERNMYLMLDVVVNHMAWKGGPLLGDYSQFVPFNSPEYFHKPCLISSFFDPNTTVREDCWLGDNVVALPDLRTEDSDVASTLNSWITDLVANYSADGLRIDSILNVEPSFFPDFVEAAGVFATGEPMDGNATQSCAYQQGNVLPSILNYPVYFPLTRAFTSSEGDLTQLVADIAWVNRTCADPTALTMFSENQDVTRFASLTSDMSLAANVLTYVIMQPGIPVVYYGAEQHLSGSTVLSANRQALWPTKYDTTAPLYELLSQLNALRNHAVTSSDSYSSAQSYVAYQDSNSIAFIRNAQDAAYTSVVLLTNNGAGAGPYTIDIATPLAAGTNMTNVLTCATVLVNGTGGLVAAVSGGRPQIYFPSESLDGSGLCGRSLNQDALPGAPPTTMSSSGGGGGGSDGSGATSPIGSPSASGSGSARPRGPDLQRLVWHLVVTVVVSRVTFPWRGG